MIPGLAPGISGGQVNPAEPNHLRGGAGGNGNSDSNAPEDRPPDSDAYGTQECSFSHDITLTHSNVNNNNSNSDYHTEQSSTHSRVTHNTKSIENLRCATLSICGLKRKLCYQEFREMIQS